MSTPEISAIARMLCGHLYTIVERGRAIPADKFDYAFALPAPTARVLVTHTYQWLVCDRQHIEIPNASQHPRLPEPPPDQQTLCDLLAAETDRWKTLILELSPEQLDEVRHQFNDPRDWSIRSILHHMYQNSVYKSGQISMIYFALGLDGKGLYEADFPNPVYEMIFGPSSDSAEG